MAMSNLKWKSYSVLLRPGCETRLKTTQRVEYLEELVFYHLNFVIQFFFFNIFISNCLNLKSILRVPKYLIKMNVSKIPLLIQIAMLLFTYK